MGRVTNADTSGVIRRWFVFIIMILLRALMPWGEAEGGAEWFFYGFKKFEKNENSKKKTHLRFNVRIPSSLIRNSCNIFRTITSMSSRPTNFPFKSARNCAISFARFTYAINNMAIVQMQMKNDANNVYAVQADISFDALLWLRFLALFIWFVWLVLWFVCCWNWTLRSRPQPLPLPAPPPHGNKNRSHSQSAVVVNLAVDGLV